MKPEQKAHAKRAEALGDQAADVIDKTVRGHSGAAAKLIHEQNLEREKAGLIKGGYKPNKVV